MLKSLKITFAPDADEEAGTMAMAHGALLLYFISMKIKSPELAAAVFKKEIKKQHWLNYNEIKYFFGQG